uniref:Uncharacterized protein n=1 Tax=Neogobius melanostomus TaxID=47308 RepID=A0A8C6U6F2_9GOBI
PQFASLDMTFLYTNFSATSLSFFYNKIERIRQTDLTGFTRLTFLHLGFNRISHIDDGSSLQMLTRLTRLTIHQNQLSRIPLTIRNMSTLTFLSFEDNLITELHCLDFTNLPSLTELNLKSNRISKLELVKCSDYFK